MSDIFIQRRADKEMLSATVDTFGDDMRARLFQKVDEGYTGWDDPTWQAECLQRIKREANALNGAMPKEVLSKKAADLANFCMFLWTLQQ